MDISLIAGWVVGAVLIVYGIGMDKLGNFLDVPSIIIVGGGTIAAIMASYPFDQLAMIPRHIMIMLSRDKYDAGKVIASLVDMAGLARKKGLLVLEEQADQIKEPFLKQSVLLIVDAMDAEKIRDLLESEVAAVSDRHDLAVSIYEKGTNVAPAFGMIGTLVGLVNMLKSMNIEDGGGSLGKDMSVALITTFYGCILAHLVFGPMAKKLRIRNDEEILYKQVIIEGVLAIQAGDNPKFLEEKLWSYMARSEKGKTSKKGKKSSVKEPPAAEGNSNNAV